MNHTDKVVIIGLDSAPPELLFGHWLKELPTLKWLTEHGLYGELESTIPSITCPAWASMVTGKDPGRLGIYGFRNRARYDYSEMAFVDSSWVREETLWDILSRYGRRSILVGIPPSYPPKAVNGRLVSCFMAGDSPDNTYPREFRAEVEALTGGYIPDVKDFRSGDKESILSTIYQMTQRRFRLAKALLSASGGQDWDLFMMVEMGTDRIQHAFGRGVLPYAPTSCGEANLSHHPESRHKDAILNYYKYLDKEIGELLTLIEGKATLMIVSDHGAKGMEGGICVNEWLLANGYLRLQEYPQKVTSFHHLKVDWKRTAAWAHSGYYGRVFLNVKGREPYGLIPPQDYERTRKEIAQGLEDIRDEGGCKINTRAFRPEEIYSECRGIAPDLLVYFGDQYWRSIGSVGHRRFWTRENDNGSDDANHSQYGIFVLYNIESRDFPKRKTAHILDVAPTVLGCMGIEVPLDMKGNVINCK